MSLREGWVPMPMRRVALLAPDDAMRDVLVRVARAGVVQLPPASPDAVTGPATELLRRTPQKPPTAVLAARAPDLRWCEEHDRLDLAAGEAQLEAVAQTGVRHSEITGLVGWAPANAVSDLAADLAPLGGAIVAVKRPHGAQPPTLLAAGGARRAFAPLVQT